MNATREALARTIPPVPHSSAALLLKRLMDLAVSIPLSLLLSPLLVLIAIAIKLNSRGPVFFVQPRWGRRLRLVNVVKFRSLRHAAPDPHEGYEMQEKDPRITVIGSVIRQTSLDELPQLFNVISGSMSLVGPRPLVEGESRACLARHTERFQMKPGITGLSQIRVRNAVDLDRRSDWDVTYVRNWSLWLDLKILLLTPWHILRGGAIYPEAQSGRDA